MSVHNIIRVHELVHEDCTGCLFVPTDDMPEAQRDAALNKCRTVRNGVTAYEACYGHIYIENTDEAKAAYVTARLEGVA